VLGVVEDKEMVNEVVTNKMTEGQPAGRALWCYTEDAIRATEKALDDALWDGLDTTYLERELAGLRLALSLGQQYQTEW